MDNLFGLGILLDYQDRASNGLMNTQRVFASTERMAQSMVNNIDRQFQRLQNISIAGMSFSQLGGDLFNLGKLMLTPLIAMGKQIVDVNSRFDTLGATFKTAFGADAQKKMDWVANFAIKTPFQIEDTARALVGLKNTGLDATKVFKDVNGQMKPFLQFAGDLATLNMGQGGGISGMLMAIRNAASGAPGGLRSLQTRFDIPKAEIQKLVGKTGDDFMQAFSEIANKLTPNAMVNMIGTWEQIISEMRDNWDVFLWRVGRVGAFDPIKKTLRSVSQAMGSMFDDDSAKAFAEIIAGLWKPIDMAVKGILKLSLALKDLVIAHPVIGKFIVSFLAFAGTTLVVSGVMLKLLGGILMTIASLGTFMLMLNQSGLTLGVLGGIVRSFLFTLLPLVALFAGMYLAWKYDLFNLRTSVTGFFGHLKSTFADARKIIGLNAEQMRIEINKLDMKNDFFSGLTKSLVKLGVLWQGLVDAWGDNTLSEENFQKLKDLGLLPTIEAILDFKMNMESLFKGFKVGAKEALEPVVWLFTRIKDAIASTGANFDPIFSALAKLFGLSNNLDANQWETLGRILGKLAVHAVGVMIAVRAIGFLVGIISTVISVGSKVWGIVTGLQGGFAALAGALGISSGALLGIIGAIALLVVGFIYLWKTNEKFRTFMIDTWNTIWGHLQSIWTTISDLAMQVWGKLKKFWAKNGEDILNQLLGMWNTITYGLQVVFQIIWDLVSLIFGGIDQFLKDNGQSILDTFMNAWGAVWTVLSTVWTIISDVARAVFDMLLTFWQQNGAAIVDLFFSVWNLVWAITEPIVNAIYTLIKIVFTAIKFYWDTWGDEIINVFKIVWSIISSIFNGAINIISGIIKIITGILTGDWAKAWEGAKQVVVGIWNAIWGTIKGVINLILNGINMLIAGINRISFDVPDWVPVIGGMKFGFNIPKIPMLNTGGYIADEGMAYLHPGEVVVNHRITEQLGDFLADNKKGSVPTSAPSGSTSVQNDNSVVFEKGSIVVNFEGGGTEQDMEALAETLMKKIEHKQQLRRIANYQPA